MCVCILCILPNSLLLGGHEAMNTDVERLLEEDTEHIETEEDLNEEGGSCCDHIYIYKMPHLTRTQLNGLDKYKVLTSIMTIT